MGMGGRMGRAGNNPDAPSPMQAQKQEVLRERYTGTTAERRAKFASDVRAWAHGQKVYLVGTQSDVEQAFGNYLKAGDLQIVRHVTLPQAPATPTRSGRMGGFGGGAGGGRRGGQFAGGPGNPPPAGAPGPMGGPAAGPGGGLPFGLGGGGGFGGRMGGGGGGGPMGLGFLAGEKELVIAEVTLPAPTTQR
jgi:translation initiation factor IF-2